MLLSLTICVYTIHTHTLCIGMYTHTHNSPCPELTVSCSLMSFTYAVSDICTWESVLLVASNMCDRHLARGHYCIIP